MRFTGIAPRGAQEWERAVERLLAIVALTFSLLSPVGRSAIVGMIGFFAAGALLIFGYSSPPDQGGLSRSVGWTSLLLQLTKTLLFPTIA